MAELFDDEFHIRLRSVRPQTQAHLSGLRGRLRLGGQAGQRHIRPKAVGITVPRAISRGRAAAAGGGGSHGGGIVKAKYVSAGRAHGLSKYLEKDVPEALTTYAGREGAGHEGHKAELFNEHGLVSEEQRQGFVFRAQRDPRLWHIIVSPPAADKLDMERFAKRFMAQVEADTGLKLDYLASTHRDTDHPHNHILIRGRARGGEEFRFEPDYVRHGMRARAEAIAERHLDLAQSREAMHEQIVEVAHSRTVPQNEASQRVHDALTKWREGHARALAGQQRSHDQGMGW